MSWHCITLEGTDRAERAATALIEAFEDSYREAGKPPGVDVFHRRRGDGSFVFYLSPTASSLFGEFVIAGQGVACDEPGSEDKRVRVRL